MSDVQTILKRRYENFMLNNPALSKKKGRTDASAPATVAVISHSTSADTIIPFYSPTKASAISFSTPPKSISIPISPHITETNSASSGLQSSLGTKTVPVPLYTSTPKVTTNNSITPHNAVHKTPPSTIRPVLTSKTSKTILLAEPTSAIASESPQVECMYDVANGISGMNRNVILRLCNVMGNNTTLIRTVCGMCGEYFRWRMHPYFVFNRLKYPKELPTLLAPTNPLSGVNYSISSSFNRNNNRFRVSFARGEYRTVAVKQRDETAVYRILLLDVKVSGNAYIGLAVKSAFPALYSESINSRSGSCMLWYGGIYTGPVSAVTLLNWRGSLPSSPPVSIQLQLNHVAHTVHFFVTKKLLGHYVVFVPEDVCFALSCYGGGGVVDLVCLRAVHYPMVTSNTTPIIPPPPPPLPPGVAKEEEEEKKKAPVGATTTEEESPANGTAPAATAVAVAIAAPKPVRRMLEAHPWV